MLISRWIVNVVETKGTRLKKNKLFDLNILWNSFLFFQLLLFKHLIYINYSFSTLACTMHQHILEKWCKFFANFALVSNFIITIIVICCCDFCIHNYYKFFALTVVVKPFPIHIQIFVIYQNKFNILCTSFTFFYLHPWQHTKNILQTFF